MGLLIRRIEMENWESSLVSLDIPLQADALGCLADSALSVWYAESGDQLDDVILAISAGLSNMNHVHLVAIDEKEINSLGFVVDHSEGETAAIPLKDLHRDINLSAAGALSLAEIVRARLSQGQLTSLTTKELARHIAQGIKRNMIDISKLKENMLAPVASALSIKPEVPKCEKCKNSTKKREIAAYREALTQAFPST